MTTGHDGQATAVTPLVVALAALTTVGATAGVLVSGGPGRHEAVTARGTLSLSGRAFDLFRPWTHMRPAP
jgi:VIT1/CCC1 family predicted Fe2+/Mn2+ transporter